MARRDPAYRRHKQSGQAVVTLSDGYGGRRDILLGPYDSPESRQKYYRTLAEWRTGGCRVPQAVAPTPDLTVNELAVAYWRYVEGYYVKNGKPTSEQDTIRQALRFVTRLYGAATAKDFGPLALKAVRQAMIAHPITIRVKRVDPETGQPELQDKPLRQGLARRYINKQVGRIRRMFGWGVEEELVPVTVHQALLRVKGLRRGKSGAREKAPIRPVPEELVAVVLPLVPPTIRTMIEVQRLCGGRPQDVVEMRAADIDMTGPVWEYRPQRYKTEHHNEDGSSDRERIVFLGPRAQALLKPYLTLNITDYLFSPGRSEEARNQQRQGARQTPRWPSHQRAQARKRQSRPRARLRNQYDVAAYRLAIRRACLRAGIPTWAPNQLRHARGTEIRKIYGLEASQAVLGHSELGVTQIYAEVDRERAKEVMRDIG